jgi:threonine synthase
MKALLAYKISIFLFAGPDIDIFLKYEGLNLTGSFVGQGHVLGYIKGRGRSSKAVICASTGILPATAAAYSGAGGLKCVLS